MAAWTNLLPRAPQSERVDAYSEYLKNQATQRDNQQKQQYNASRIAEQQVITAQKQRVMQHQDVLDKAYSNNVKINPDTGELTVNYAGIHNDIAKGGAGELSPGVDKERIATETAAHQAIEANLKAKAEQADTLMRHIASIDPVQDFNNRAQVDHFSLQAIQAINSAEQQGALSKEEAAQYRQQAANPTPQFQSELQQHMKAGPNYLKVLDQMGKVNQNTHESRMQPLQEAKEGADASTAQTKATQAQLGLAGQVGDVYPGVQNSEIGGNAPQAANPYQSAPAAGPYTAPQAAPAPATGNVDPRTGQPYINPTPNTAPMSEDARAQGIRIPAPAGQFDTKLSPQDEVKFQAWKAKYAPNDTGADYDLRGAYKSGLTPDPQRGHWPDTFKKPNHPTFSDESQYHGQGGNVGGHWGDDGTFTPGATNLQNRTPAELQQYFKQNEPDTKLNLPGSTPRDPKWTQYKQASWDAKRATFPQAAKFMPPVWSEQAERDLKTHALTAEQQVTKPGTDLRNTGTELDNQKKLRNDWSTKFQVAIDKGMGSYTRTYDSAPPEIQKMMDDPDHFDQKATMRRARLMGETAAQAEADQDKHDKPAGAKAPTPVELNAIETAKNATLRAAKNLYRKDTASVLGKSKFDQHLSTLRDATQNAQNEYENKLKQFGLEVKHMEYPAASEWDKGGFPKSGASTPATKPAPKSATMDQVKAYAAKSGKTEAQVIQEAKDSGIDVQ